MQSKNKFDREYLIDQAKEILSKFGEPLNIYYYEFPQTWGSTSCGFGELGGAAMTCVQTSMVESPMLGLACIFINSYYAYTVKMNDEKFKEDIQKRFVLGKINAHKFYEIVDI